jgi:hypothetical protein
VLGTPAASPRSSSTGSERGPARPRRPRTTRAPGVVTTSRRDRVWHGAGQRPGHPPDTCRAVRAFFTTRSRQGTPGAGADLQSSRPTRRAVDDSSRPRTTFRHAARRRSPAASSPPSLPRRPAHQRSPTSPGSGAAVETTRRAAGSTSATSAGHPTVTADGGRKPLENLGGPALRPLICDWPSPDRRPGGVPPGARDAPRLDGAFVSSRAAARKTSSVPADHRNRCWENPSTWPR